MTKRVPHARHISFASLLLATSTSTFAIDYASTIQSQGAVAYWKFDETAGTAANQVGGAPAGTVAASVQRGQAGVGPNTGFLGFDVGNTAYRFRDDANSVVTNLTGASPVSAAQGSVSLWFRAATDDLGMIYYGGTSGDGFGEDNELHVNIDALGRLELYIEDAPSGGDRRITSTGSYNNSEWHHVVATWDATSTHLYIDGGNVTGGETVNGAGSNSNATYTGSAARAGKPTNNTRYFVGLIDELALFSTDITAADAADQYNAAVGDTTNTQFINAITNGGFESGTTGWTITGNTGTNNTAGRPSEGASLLNFNSGQNTPNGTASQTFATLAGYEYDLLFDIAKFATGTGSANFLVEVFDGTGFGGTLLLSTTASDPTGDGTTPISYDTFGFRFTALSALTTLRFTDTSSNSGTSFDAYLDNVRVLTADTTIIPEPATATLGLLGLAGLMMRRRRMA